MKPHSSERDTVAAMSAGESIYAMSPKSSINVSNVKEDRNHVLLSAFSSGRFSDVSLVIHSHIYKLHRIILLQSPFLARLLLDEHKQEMVIVEDALVLECIGDVRISRAGMESALRDLYSPPSSRSLINAQTALSILAAACYLELPSLAHHCTTTLLSTLSPTSILSLASALETMRPPADMRSMTRYGNTHMYPRLFSRHWGLLDKAVEGYLCLAVGGLWSRLKHGDQQESEDQQLLDELLGGLPLCWVRRVVESDTLCIGSEFERYEMVKRIYEVRKKWAAEKGDTGVEGTVNEDPLNSLVRQNADVTHGSKVSEMDVSMWSEADRSSLVLDKRDGEDAVEDVDGGEEVTEFANVGVEEGGFGFKSYFGSLLNRVVVGKRKRDGSNDEEEIGGRSSQSGTHEDKENAIAVNDGQRKNWQSLSSRKLRVPPHMRPGLAPQHQSLSASASNVSRTPLGRTSNMSTTTNTAVHVPFNEEEVQKLFLTAVTYTYMTFPQLETVKSDGIVPIQVVLESFWVQAEVASRGFIRGMKIGTNGGNGFPPFRFAVRFREVEKYFFGGESTNATMSQGEVVASIMCSESVVCAGSQYRVLLSLGVDDERVNSGSGTTTGSGSTDAGRRQTVVEDAESPSKRSDSSVSLASVETQQEPGDEQTSTLSTLRVGTSGKENGARAGVTSPGGRQVLRALLQRNRVTDGKSRQTQAPGISYRIYGFLHECGSNHLVPARSTSINKKIKGGDGAGTGEEHEVKAVTLCDFEGNGFVEGFGGEWLNSGRKRKNSKDELWVVVVIEYAA
ncbi:hypothetical protein HDU85_006176 [Gaertneriomyces sp. JEL0708]|nr:hypothetical protein HDU85_006176 [Gaertneriomyces sp. JEL0708]